MTTHILDTDGNRALCGVDARHYRPAIDAAEAECKACAEIQAIRRTITPLGLFPILWKDATGALRRLRSQAGRKSAASLVAFAILNAGQIIAFTLLKVFCAAAIAIYAGYISMPRILDWLTRDSNLPIDARQEFYGEAYPILLPIVIGAYFYALIYGLPLLWQLVKLISEWSLTRKRPEATRGRYRFEKDG